VREEGERLVAIDDGREVKTRWVSLAEVGRNADGAPIHPQIEDLPLEEVIEKMSKSRGNVVNPDEVIEAFGADSMRLYEMFLGPLDKDAPWSTDGIQGMRRFLERAWRLVVDDETGSTRSLPEGPGSDEQQRLTTKTVHGVTEDLEAMRFNTAISKMMVFARDIAHDGAPTRSSVESFCLLLAPFAPHLAEELWQRLGHDKSLAREAWPEADASLLEEDEVTLVVQVNGKKRADLRVAVDADEATIRTAALALDAVQKHLDGKEPKKVIVVPGRVVNIVRG